MMNLSNFSLRTSCALLCALLSVMSLTALAPLAAQSATRVELPSGITVIHHDNNLSHTAQVSLLVRSAPLHEGARLGSGVSNVLREVLAQRWRSLQGARLGPLQSSTEWAVSSFNVTTADSQILPTVASLAQLVNPQEWSEAGVARARDLVLAELAVRERRLPLLERDALFRLALLRHPARLPPAGRAEQVTMLTLEQLRVWHQQSYRAPAMTVVVVGNCDQQQLFAKVEEVFAPFALGGWSVPVVPTEPEQFASRHHEIPVSIGLDRDRYVFAWRLPVASRREFPALLLAAEVLDAPTGSLRQRLQNEQLATDVAIAVVTPPQAPAYLTIAYTPFPERAGLARSVMQETLRELTTSSTAKELIERAQRKLHRRFLLRDATTAGKLALLSESEVMTLTPDFYSLRLLPQVKAVTTRQLQQAVSLWLRPDGSNRLSIILRSVQEQTAESVEGEGDGLAPAEVTVAPVAGDVPPELLLAEDGLRMLSQRLPTGLVEVGLHLGGGEGVVNPAIAGAAGVLAEVLALGSTKRHGEQLAAYLDRRGMELHVSAGYHSLDLRVTCFPEDALAAAALLVNIIQDPVYIEDDVTLAVQQAQAALAQADDDRHWSEILREEVMQRAFADSAFGRPLLGTKRGLQNVTKGVVDELKTRMLVSGNTMITLNGSYDADVLPQQIWEMIQAAEIPAGVQQQPKAEPWPEGAEAAVFQRNWQQNESGLAFVTRAPEATNVGADGPVFDLLLTLLVGADGRGGRLGSLLAQQQFGGVRGPFLERVSSPGRGIELFLLHGDQAILPQVQEVMRQAIQQLDADLQAEGGLKAEELAQGRSASIASRSRQDDRRLMTLDDDVAALLFGYLESIGNVAYQQAINQTTLDDLRRVCRKYLMREVFSIVLGEPVEQPVANPGEAAEPEAEPAAPDVVPPPVESEEPLLPPIEAGAAPEAGAAE